jgi:hypothetical protein
MEKSARVLSFEYRRNDEEFVDSALISLRTKKVIKSKVRTNRRGRGRRTYFLLPAKYLVYSVHKSQGGLNITVSIIKLKAVDGGVNLRFIREWKLNELPSEIRSIIDSNKDHLPFIETAT